MIHNFDIRWCLDYVDKPTIYGEWNSDIKKAYEQNLRGMTLARIELMDRVKNKIITVLDCTKDSFLCFHWHKICPQVQITGKNCVDMQTYIFGLMMVTNEKKISFFIDGTYSIEDNTEQIEQIYPSKFI